MGEERLEALIQESLAVAAKSGALKPSELTAVVVDTTVQPKNLAHPTDAKRLNRARELACAHPEKAEAPKIYALHAPEVECIGKGKAHKPYEFGVKVSLAITAAASKGGQFVLHAKALPGNPYDGHTLKTVLPAIEATTGAALSRFLADAGYKGHNAQERHKLKVYAQGQKRGVTDAIKRQLKRRAAIEPVIGHCKATAWAGTSSPTGTAMPSTPCSPQPVTTSTASWLGSDLPCACRCKPSHTGLRVKTPETQNFTADYFRRLRRYQARSGASSRKDTALSGIMTY